METIETIKYKGCKIELVQDEDAPNPRTDWDNVGVMLCKHRDYILGDRKRGETEPGADEIIEVTQRKDVLWMPLYLYDHSGITIKAGSAHSNWIDNTNQFVGDSAGWDTSTVGIIYCTKKQAVEEWGKKKFTKEVAAKALAYLKGEVETYASYLEGDVIGYITKGPDGEDIDSCWGFFPDDSQGYGKRWDYPIGEAKSSINHWLEKRNAQKEQWEMQT